MAKYEASQLSPVEEEPVQEAQGAVVEDEAPSTTEETSTDQSKEN